MLGTLTVFEHLMSSSNIYVFGVKRLNDFMNIEQLFISVSVGGQPNSIYETPLKSKILRQSLWILIEIQDFIRSFFSIGAKIDEDNPIKLLVIILSGVGFYPQSEKVKVVPVGKLQIKKQNQERGSVFVFDVHIRTTEG